MISCTLCGKMSVIAEISKDKLCMACESDFREGLEKCGNCGEWMDEEEAAEFDGWCYNCYNKDCNREFNEQKHPDDHTKH